MGLLNETHIARNAPQGTTVVQGGRYLPPPEDKDGKIWVRTSAIIQAAPDKALRALARHRVRPRLAGAAKTSC